MKRPAEARGRTELNWLRSFHTFSFGDYFDPDFMGFRSLRVINEDTVAPGHGFGAHPHSDAEIFTYVIEGELQHKDSMGNGSVIRAGDFQYMSAGSGIRHSEFNPSETEAVHFLQIWLMPNVSGGEPRYAERAFSDHGDEEGVTMVFAGDPSLGAIVIRQNAVISIGRISRQRAFPVELEDERHAWLQIIRGRMQILDEVLVQGDGAAISNVPALEIKAEEDLEFLLFDLP